MESPDSVKIDLHLHSKYSRNPSTWILKKIGCPESFSEPLLLYQLARERGLTHVTITDHNQLAGSLDIAHLPNAFISEEVTTYFPEDRCKLHVLVYRIDEATHREIQTLRENVFELVPYLRSRGIFHVLAHPLFGVNERLTLGHFEQCLLLFNYFELNGARDGQLNILLQELLSRLRKLDKYLHKDLLLRLLHRFLHSPFFSRSETSCWTTCPEGTSSAFSKPSVPPVRCISLWPPISSPFPTSPRTGAWPVRSADPVPSARPPHQTPADCGLPILPIPFIRSTGWH